MHGQAMKALQETKARQAADIYADAFRRLGRNLEALKFDKVTDESCLKAQLTALTKDFMVGLVTQGLVLIEPEIEPEIIQRDDGYHASFDLVPVTMAILKFYTPDMEYIFITRLKQEHGIDFDKSFEV